MTSADIELESTEVADVAPKIIDAASSCNAAPSIRTIDNGKAGTQMIRGDV